MATIYEVSKLAGVSLATVSRVMNNNSRVSPKNREKVQQAMKLLGYKPNSIAQSLASNRSNSIGIMVSELNGSFYGLMTGAIEKKFRAYGKHVIITPGHCDMEKEREGIEFLISRRCDALILHVEAVSDEYLIELSKGDTPIIILSRYVNEIADRCISLNNESGGYLATKALIDAGHKKIAYIAGPLFKTDSTDRLNGHKRALREANLQMDDRLLYVGDFREVGGMEGLQHFIDNNFDFSAVVCANDEMASGAMKYAREHDYNLPEDLSIVGFDNIIFANYLYPTLSTINNPIGEMGCMAASMILESIYNEKNIGEIKHAFEPCFISRNSIAQLN